MAKEDGSHPLIGLTPEIPTPGGLKTVRTELEDIYAPVEVKGVLFSPEYGNNFHGVLNPGSLSVYFNHGIIQLFFPRVRPSEKVQSPDLTYLMLNIAQTDSFVMLQPFATLEDVPYSTLERDKPQVVEDIRASSYFYTDGDGKRICRISLGGSGLAKTQTVKDGRTIDLYTAYPAYSFADVPAITLNGIELPDLSQFTPEELPGLFADFDFLRVKNTFGQPISTPPGKNTMFVTIDSSNPTTSPQQAVLWREGPFSFRRALLKNEEWIMDETEHIMPPTTSLDQLQFAHGNLGGGIGFMGPTILARGNYTDMDGNVYKNVNVVQIHGFSRNSTGTAIDEYIYSTQALAIWNSDWSTILHITPEANITYDNVKSQVDKLGLNPLTEINAPEGKKVIYACGENLIIIDGIKYLETYLTYEDGMVLRVHTPLDELLTKKIGSKLAKY